MLKSDRPFDVVVYGASSFVGQILVRYMWARYGQQGELKWAIAGRSQAKLNDLLLSLGSDALSLPTLVADAADEIALQQLCAQTSVVVSTVGPYALYGEPLLRACVGEGIDYLDLTGEPQWISAMLAKYEQKAVETGARIVHCCGFDSIPSDLGVLYLQRIALERFGMPCQSVRMRVKALKGEASGGTIASLVNVAKQAASDKSLRRLLANPYALCPADHGFHQRQKNIKGAEFEKETNRWIAPFVMAAINTRIVHRSNALLNAQYGNDFEYDEAMFTGSDVAGAVRGWTLAIGLSSLMIGAALPPTRWLLENYLLPKPGEGPSPKAQEEGFYDMRFYGKTVNGDSITVKVTGDRDPGYGSTAKMLAEAALCFVFEPSVKPLQGGFWTPASAFGATLIERLEEFAGLTFELIEH